MYRNLIGNDIKRSKMVTAAITIFILSSALLVSLAVIMAVNLFGAIDSMMENAKTPHFLQMHTGEIDRERLARFADENDNVSAFQVLEFLNMEGARIHLGETSLSNSVQDNGFSTQSKVFDFLMDLNSEPIHVADGELYVPIEYLKDGTTQIGDAASICGTSFTVAGFLRDSQMNSTLSSSKRFLISENDYHSIYECGNVEYLIEFRLNDTANPGIFEAEYVAAGLESNGPTVTYPLFRIMNAISDGLMIAVLLLISFLIVIVAFLCIRFTLLAKIEDETHEIGVMKAIGLRVSDIKRIYQLKYGVLALVGCLTGFALSFLFKETLLENIRLYMGGTDQASRAFWVGILAIGLVFFSILIFVNTVLRRFDRISPAEAIRYGTIQENPGNIGPFKLSQNRALPVNVLLGIKDVIVRKKMYFTMLVILIIASFIMIVPQNISSTISSDTFITYMGIGLSDLLISVQQTDDILSKAEKMDQAFAQDPDVAKHAILISKIFELKTADGLSKRIKIELGDHTMFPIQYASGNAPQTDDEIALSAINADEMGAAVGDKIQVMVDGVEKTLTVCGVYSDITNGGKTAKARFQDSSTEVLWITIPLSFSPGVLPAEKTSAYGKDFPYAKVASVGAHFEQMFGSTVSAIQKAAWAAILAAVLISGLILLLFMKMLTAKDRSRIAILKALGFTNSDIKHQYFSGTIFILLLGTLLGTLLANTVGEAFGSALIAFFGASSFKFIVNPFVAYFLCPLTIAVTITAASMIGLSQTGKIQISESIKE